MNKKELWLNIANYHFDNLVPTHFWDEIISKFGGQSPFTKAFADKLCRKFNWKKQFAMKAIWEYKKFVYLGVISDCGVTPSKIIDQVWHEHLLFSVGYRNFCKNIIEYDFDHNPELVSINSQTETFQSQYFYTIDLYKKEFGLEPPEEIWDATKFQGNAEGIKKPKKNKLVSTVYGTDDNSETLISFFPSVESHDVEFGGGEFGGGGATASWGFDNDESSDSDDGGSDGGTSCSSSCGSSCGGGD